MPAFYLFLLWFIILFFQIVVAPRIAIFGVYPDAVLAATILMGLKREWRLGLWFGFALGIAVDLINPQNFGWMTLTVALTGCFAGVIKEKIFLDTIYYQTATVAAFSFVYQLIIRLVLWPSYFFGNFWISLADSFFIAIYTSIIAIVTLVLLKQRYRLKELL